ncbi:MAG: membrane protein containing DUF373 [Candidatus Syntrophoarchaeum caldarius]|uniref:Membrane protein containing DUF373 n=1 Tax=Candidatus Syntropharchaeum caldarium TaxID=1838285 RepID=A0A1F2PCG8_9EURY|nr:MAG: membrane protein containing DUF373 [Candidatus Syntrophoarchaeum caldarius]
MEKDEKILIICIDRDDDLGRKTGIETPIIGREVNLKSAMELGLADPEESDMNCILGGIKLYDRLIAEKREVEIVTLGGSEEVGVVSDMIIAEKLDNVLERIEATRAIVVSDGADDEFILPLIQSRIPIDSVHRVVVRQSERLESAFYLIKQTLLDPRFSRSTLIPAGLVSLIYAVSIIFGHPEWATVSIFAFIGIYLLFLGVGLGDLMQNFFSAVKESFYGGKITFVTYIAALIIALVGTVQGGVGTWNYYVLHYSELPGYLLLFMVFLNESIWWYTGAGVLSWCGRMINMYLDRGAYWRHWASPLIILAFGLMMWGGSESVRLILEGSSGEGVRLLIFSIMGAVLISIIGVWISQSIKNYYSEDDQIEKDII